MASGEGFYTTATDSTETDEQKPTSDQQEWMDLTTRPITPVFNRSLDIEGTLIIIEGNIGVGKSSVLENLKGDKSLTLLAEPLPVWRDVEGGNLLKNFYDDPKLFAFTLQMHVLDSYRRLLDISVKSQIRVMERSPHASIAIFAESAHRRGMLTDSQMAWLLSEFGRLFHGERVGHVIYLHSTPSIAYQRMIARGRDEEKNVTKDYLKQLHELYEDWLVNQKGKHVSPAEVTVVDGDQAMEDVLQDVRNIIHTVYQNNHAN